MIKIAKNCIFDDTSRIQCEKKKKTQFLTVKGQKLTVKVKVNSTAGFLFTYFHQIEGVEVKQTFLSIVRLPDYRRREFVLAILFPSRLLSSI